MHIFANQKISVKKTAYLRRFALLDNGNWKKESFFKPKGFMWNVKNICAGFGPKNGHDAWEQPFSDLRFYVSILEKHEKTENGL